MVAARVAGVPRPEDFICSRSASSSISRPAFSISFSSEASVWGAGGLVFNALTVAFSTRRASPTASLGSGGSLSSSALSPWYSARQPSASGIAPVDLKLCCPTWVITFAASYS